LTPIVPTLADVAIAGFFAISVFFRADAAVDTMKFALCAIDIAAGILVGSAMDAFGTPLMAAMFLGAGALGATLGFLAMALDMPDSSMGGLGSSVDDMGLGVGCDGGLSKATFLAVGVTDGIADLRGAWSGKSDLKFAGMAAVCLMGGATLGLVGEELPPAPGGGGLDAMIIAFDSFLFVGF